VECAKERYFSFRAKALIGATGEATFGQSLVVAKLLLEFIELLRGKTAVDKLSPRMRRVPFNIKIPSQTGASTVGWVGEGKRKPTTNIWKYYID
jgi:hypothetical protein